MMPGDNCPECDRRLSSDQCPCGWRAATVSAGPPKCDRCPARDGSVQPHDDRNLCLTCRFDVMRLNAATDEDLTESGETVGQLKARLRGLLASSAHKWESHRSGSREILPL